MSKLGLAIVLILMAGKNNAQDYMTSSNSQQSFFVLIQADNNQAFYVRLDSQLYTSSAAGHLILSKLKDSIYTITIGFPGQVFPEQRFVFSVHEMDQAFRLKDVNGKDWRLYDGRGQQLEMADGERGIDKPTIAGVKKDDPFSRMMAAVVRDTAVMYNTGLTHSLSDSVLSGVSTEPPFPGIPSPTTRVTATTTSMVPDSKTLPLTTSAIPPSIPPTLSFRTPDSTTAFSLPRDATQSSSSAIRDTSGLSAGMKNGRAPMHTEPEAVTTSSPNADSTASILSSVSASMASHSDSNASSLRSDSQATPPLYHRSNVVKLSERKSSKALRLVYADHPTDKKADTIVVIIPLDTTAAQLGTTIPYSAPSVTSTPPLSPTRGTVSSALRTEHPHALVLPADTVHLAVPGGHAPNPDSPVLKSGAVSHPKSALPFVNSDCHAYATDYDVDRLRAKMLEVARDEERILTARKFFKIKCFSTHQIKALSEVFNTDASKFKFLEVAYPFVSDDHFPELINLFADPVYSGRFKTMTDRH
jgi:hypothetical protein